jgi:hypothetical protein
MDLAEIVHQLNILLPVRCHNPLEFLLTKQSTDAVFTGQREEKEQINVVDDIKQCGEGNIKEEPPVEKERNED